MAAMTRVPPNGAPGGRSQPLPKAFAAPAASSSGVTSRSALGDVPAMPEWVDDLAVALAPELIGELLAHLGARSERPSSERVGVVCLDLQDGRGAANRQWREDPGIRELAGEVEARVADRRVPAAGLDELPLTFGSRRPGSAG